MFHSDKGKPTYSITTRRITSGDDLKYQNGLAGLGARGIQPHRRAEPIEALRLTVPSGAPMRFSSQKEAMLYGTWT